MVVQATYGEYAEIKYPVFDPVAGVLTYLTQYFTAIFTATPFFSNGGIGIIDSAIERLNNPQWINGGDPTHTVIQPVVAGQQVISARLPIGVNLNLIAAPKFVNNWYGSSSLGKLGFCRQVSNGYHTEAVWINDYLQSVTFPTPFADAIEICLAPGVTGSATIIQWSGIPPLYAALDINGYLQPQQQITGGWDWFINGPAP